MTRIIIVAALLFPLMISCSKEEVADKAGNLTDMAAKYKDMSADKMGEALKKIDFSAMMEKGKALTGDAKTGFMDKFKSVSGMKDQLMGMISKGFTGDMAAKAAGMMPKIMTGVAALKKMIGM